MSLLWASVFLRNFSLIRNILNTINFTTQNRPVPLDISRSSQRPVQSLRIYYFLIDLIQNVQIWSAVNCCLNQCLGSTIYFGVKQEIL